MNSDTIDWLDLDLWPEKEVHKAADMDNSYPWLAQQGQALSGHPFSHSHHQLQPQMMQPSDGLLFPDTFNPQSTAGSLLSELSGVRAQLPHSYFSSLHFCLNFPADRIVPQQDFLEAAADISNLPYETGPEISQQQQSNMQLRSDTAQNGAMQPLSDMMQGSAFGHSASMSPQAGRLPVYHVVAGPV